MNLIFLFLFFQLFLGLNCNNPAEQSVDVLEIKPGAFQMEEYIPLLKDKNVALVVNNASRLGETHLVDTLIDQGINVVRIFSAEHGFRGDADAGEKVDNETDSATGVSVTSLYGNRKKPLKEDMSGVDVVVFDLQDVGVRFYTYLSTLSYIIESCSENHLPLIVLDRPNPNISKIDGPVLNLDYQSFVGLHPVPVLYGMTIGEYAIMINNEGWTGAQEKCRIKLVTCKNYTRSSDYVLPVKPSPNLPNNQAICLYPGLCFLEPTTVSVGRGTDKPFQQAGHPELRSFNYSFTPRSTVGAKHPKHENTACYGIDLSNENCNQSGLDLKYLIQFHALCQKSETQFITNERFFDLLAGSSDLRESLMRGDNESMIRDSWKQDLDNFKKIRLNYLVYED